LCGQMLDYALMGTRPKPKNKKLEHGYKTLRNEPQQASILTL
jgi:hypothetical protein